MPVTEPVCRKVPFWRSTRKGLTFLGLALLLMPVILALAGLAVFAPPGVRDFMETLRDAYVWHVVGFTFLQALLSTLLSLMGGLLLARSLFRRGAFAGRVWLERLMLLPMVLPQIVVVLGFLAVWGRQGWIRHLIYLAGVDTDVSIYGLTGILMAHAFYNVPLAARLLLARLEGVPGEYWRLAAQLGMPPLRVFTLVEWPAMRTVLPGVGVLIFMLCATSFTVVLILGGGPAATTLEVAIYQALRFDFMPERAMVLSLLQLMLMAAVHIILRYFGAPEQGEAGSFRRDVRHPFAYRAGARVWDVAVITMAALYLILPLAAVIIDGVAAFSTTVLLREEVMDAVLTSLSVSVAAAHFALFVVFLMLAYLHHPRGILPDDGWTRFSDAIASLVLVVPVVTLAAGWFLLLLVFDAVELMAPVVVIVLNAIMVLPFVWRVLNPAARMVQDRNGRLTVQLAMGWRARVRLVDWPLLKKAVGLAIALAMAMSVGDLGSIALFGSESFHTLPWLIYRALGSYRSDEAASLSLLLLIMVGGFLSVAGLFETSAEGRKGTVPAVKR